MYALKKTLISCSCKAEIAENQMQTSVVMSWIIAQVELPASKSIYY